MHKVSKLQYTKQQHTKEIHESIRLTMNLKLIDKSSTFNWVRRARSRRYADGVRPILAPLRHSSSNEVKREILEMIAEAPAAVMRLFPISKTRNKGRW